MAKARSEYVCSECGGTSVKWQGRCPHCGAWNTMQEFKISSGAASRYGVARQRLRGIVETSEVLDLSEVEAKELPRIITGLEEFDRVIGGGLVAGGVALIGGTRELASRHCFCR